MVLKSHLKITKVDSTFCNFAQNTKRFKKYLSQTMAVTTKAELRKDIFYSTISLEYIIENFTNVSTKM